jgi:hypothetical protein
MKTNLVVRPFEGTSAQPVDCRVSGHVAPNPNPGFPKVGNVTRQTPCLRPKALR